MLRARVAELERERDEALEHGQAQRIQFEGELESLRQATHPCRAMSTDEQLDALKAVFEAITDGVVVYDRAGAIISANSAFHQMMGITSPADYISLSMYERFSRIHVRDGEGRDLTEDALPVARLARGEVIASGDPVDLTFQTLDGREIFTDVSGAPLLDMSGTIAGMVVVFHDITARKHLERQTNEVLQTLKEEQVRSQANESALLETNRRMDEFLSIASHELRTPLTTINGNIQLAKRRVDTLLAPTRELAAYQDKLRLIRELLNRAERQVRIQNRLVGDLLDVSRIQGNRLQLDMDDTNLVEIVRNAVEDQRSASPGRVILLQDDSEGRALPVHADADRIGQVITNFLTNALKYSASDRVVEVRIEVVESSVKVSVRDEGPGLPPEEQKMLWDRFYRVPGIVVQSGSGVGLGLGLHICQTIITRHGGEVGVDSEVGKGSVFWFKLPLVSNFVTT
ncbi:hypothetical protein KDH_57820 [Dictyobacter sp. S3.2.2.5]|uniref:histidine kinase n=1 Tax=Dictyobacter halimunensis TaxID=3026934 RepID=A0ABQ6G2A7_9CHLR|nr:hypothetical protein KDH_57820 [Dictyobacter sp. S3.2.2.5]